MRALVAAMAAIAMLLAVSGAQAATIKMTSTGLVIDSSGDGDSKADFTISADTRTPSGEIARWKIVAFTCDPIPALGGTCLDPVGPACKEPGPGDPDFGTPFGSTVRCDRTAAGVKVLTGGGDDEVALFTESDPATVDLGSGNDSLEGLLDPLLGLRISNGAWNVTGGAGNDTINGSTGGNVIDGGPGNDTLRGFPIQQDVGLKHLDAGRPELSGGDSIFGGSGNDYIDAGNGSDSVSGGDGDDTFNAGAEDTLSDLASPDAYDGGNGFDTIDYSQRTSDLFFDSGSVQSGSIGVTPHELDKDSRIEHAILGSGNDTALSLLDVLPKRTLEGRGGNDTLNGVSTSDDTLIGGLGADHLNGFGGNDVLDAKDGIPDVIISCGAGTDIAKLDLKDPNPFDPVNCETITREAVQEAAMVRLVSARRSRSGVRVTLACPRHDDRRCNGKLDAGGSGVHYLIARGKQKTVALRTKHRSKVRLRSVETGKFGDKTVIRTLRVKKGSR